MDWLKAWWARLERADRRIAVPAAILLAVGAVTLVAHGPQGLANSTIVAGFALMAIWSVHTLRQMRHWRRVAEQAIAERDASQHPAKSPPPK